MKISKEALLQQASITDFRPEMIEKVWHLMSLLNGIYGHPYLKNRVVLKGGTALNLFIFQLPRLSVDIDLNYIGQTDKSLMLEERPIIEKALKAVCNSQTMEITRSPEEHAGGKFEIKYESALNSYGNLSFDINYMYRVPLWGIEQKKSTDVGGVTTEVVSVLSVEELAAGKLLALFSRNTSRDLLDTYHLLEAGLVDREKLKLSFFLYGIMGGKDLRKLTVDTIKFNKEELSNKLIPVLRKKYVEEHFSTKEGLERIETFCKDSLQDVIEFWSQKNDIVARFYKEGMLSLEEITNDADLIGKMKIHPLLLWRKQQILKRI